jgi:hypothetical protein
MSNVTHANERMLERCCGRRSPCNFRLDPVSPLQVTLKRSGKVLYDNKVIPIEEGQHRCRADPGGR